MFNEAIYISFIAQPSVFVNQMCDWSEVTIQNVLKRAKYVTLRKKRKKDKNYSSADGEQSNLKIDDKQQVMALWRLRAKT
jgi:hypothetical protein